MIVLSTIAIITTILSLFLAFWLSWIKIELKFAREMRKVQTDYITELEEHIRYLIHDLLPKFLEAIREDETNGPESSN